MKITSKNADNSVNKFGELVLTNEVQYDSVEQMREDYQKRLGHLAEISEVKGGLSLKYLKPTHSAIQEVIL